MAVHECKCKSAYQDKQYGPGKRVFTGSVSKRQGKGKDGKNKGSTSRCTVCGTVRQ